MRIVANQSPYAAKTVRRILTAVYPGVATLTAVPVGWWDKLRVRLITGRGRRPSASGQYAPLDPKMTLVLPALRGTEFIGLLRQQYGGQTEHDHGGLKSQELALVVQAGLLEILSARAPGWTDRVLTAAAGKNMRRVPALVPIRIIKSAPPKDELRERLARTIGLKMAWQRKAKLAATKIKKLSQRQKRYEKQLAAREAT